MSYSNLNLACDISENDIEESESFYVNVKYVKQYT